MPWPIRSACSSSRQASTLAGPASSPPCGTRSSPARSAIPNAAANSCAAPRRSSLDRPNPVTPRPAYWAASRARVLASSGCLVRLAATITPMPTPVAAAAAAAASRTSSIMSVMPPNRPAYPDGSTWISSQPEPSARSSRAVSVSSRRTSAGAQHRARGVVQPLEPEPAALVGAAQPRRPVLGERGGSRMPRSRASSTSVPCRIDPVKCRCRCALGSWASGRDIRLVCGA